MILATIPSDGITYCFPSPCYLVTFRTKNCEFKTITNRDNVEGWIRSDGGREDAAVYDSWRARISSISGVQIEVSEVTYKKVPCKKDSQLVMVDDDYPIGTTKYFYVTENSTLCDAFREGPVTKFWSDRCCDIVPANPSCLTPEILSDVPEFLEEAVLNKTEGK